MTLTHDTAVSTARAIAHDIVAPAAAQNDAESRFPSESVEALGHEGLLALMLPAHLGGSGLGPRAFMDVVAALAEADPSVAMVFVMHSLAVATMMPRAAAPAVRLALREIATGRHLSTLAFSESGSRSHFWAPVSRAERNGTGVFITARKSWVTSAGHAQSYVVSTLSPTAIQPTESTLYLVRADAPGLQVAGRWAGMGLRANASAPMLLDRCVAPDDHQLTDEGGGFKVMIEVVLPLFNLGSAAVSLGICRAAVEATATHLKTARFEHLGATLGEALPNLRANLASMQIDTDGLAARLDDVVRHLERPRPDTMLRVLESKAAAADNAVAVTSMGMRTCGGAAFSRHTSLERYFRDAHAGNVMAPTGDVLREFIGRALLGLPLF
jgi:alkylation response protein AidB-like acyl-CoA dehydrogenase